MTHAEIKEKMIWAGKVLVNEGQDDFTRGHISFRLPDNPSLFFMTMYKNLAFDAEKDFVTIGLINTAAAAWTGKADLPPNNVKEMIAWMKAPGNNAKIAHD